jgi:hypothetical protein
MIEPVNDRVDTVTLKSSTPLDAYLCDRHTVQRFDWVEVDSTKKHTFRLRLIDQVGSGLLSLDGLKKNVAAFFLM